jgi:hypothetical protein
LVVDDVPNLVRGTGRTFVMARYIAAHQQLLFRSAIGDGGPNRVDIVFGGVQYLNLRTLVYENFNVYELGYEEFKSVGGRLAPVAPSSCHYYGFGDEGIEGVMIAISFVEHTDKGQEWEPSAILRFDTLDGR